MTDAYMLEHWKDSFNLEPQAEVTAYVEKDEEKEGEVADGEFRKTISKKAQKTKAKNRSNEVKALLSNLAGLEDFLKAKIATEGK